MDPVSSDDLRVLFEKIYIQVVSILANTSLSGLLSPPSEMRWLEKHKELKDGNSVVRYSALRTTEGGKIIEVVIRLGSTSSEVLPHVIDLFERKEDILIQLNGLELNDLAEAKSSDERFSVHRSIKNVILWNDPVSMNISDDYDDDDPVPGEPQGTLLVINFTVIHESVIDYITPMKRRDMAISNGKIDFSLIRGNLDTLVLCHGHGYDDLGFRRPVMYADYNIKAFPDIVVDILNDRFAPCHCFDNVYMIGCPVYQFEIQDLRVLVNNIFNVIKKGGRLYLTWYAGLFPEYHPQYQNTGGDTNKIYEYLTSRYFDYEDYIQDFGMNLLVLKRK